MGLTTEGLNHLGYVLVNGSTLDLLDTSGNAPSASLNYASIPCAWENYPSGVTDPEKEHIAVFTAENGVLTNKTEFLTNEADDPSYDYGSGTPGPGWGTLTQISISRNGTELYRGNLTNSSGQATSVTVPQDYQVRFKTGAIRITFTVTEVQA